MVNKQKLSEKERKKHLSSNLVVRYSALLRLSPQLLPSATDIYNYVYDGAGGGRLDNIIRFYKSWILKSVRAVTKYRVRAGRGDSSGGGEGGCGGGIPAK